MKLASLVFALIVSHLAAVPSSLAQCVEPPPGLVSWWKAEASAIDEEGVNHGTLQNGATFAPGKVGFAFSLDGADDYIDLGDDPSGRPDFPFSIDAWVNVDGPSFRILSSSQQGGNGHYSGFTFGVSSGLGLYTHVGDDGPGCHPDNRRTNVTTGSLITPGTWHHVAAVYESFSVRRLYVDGVEIPSTVTGNATSMAYNAAARLTIGRTYGGPSPCTAGFTYSDGLVDEIELHNVALTTAEIAAIYEADSDGKCTEPPVATESMTWGALKSSYE